MYAMELLLRVMHVLGAVMLLGGIFYQKFAINPALGSATEDPTHATARETLRRRAAGMTMLASLLLIASGLVNTARASIEYRFPNGDYHLLLAAKLVLALLIFALAALLTGRSAAAQKVRANASLWLNVLLVASLVLLGLAAAMKLAVREPKKAEEPERSSVSYYEAVPQAMAAQL